MSTNANATGSHSNLPSSAKNGQKDVRPNSPPSIRTKHSSAASLSAAAMAAYATGKGSSPGTPKRKPTPSATSPRKGEKKKQTKAEEVNQKESGGPKVPGKTSGRKSSGEKDPVQASGVSNSRKDKGPQSVGKAKGSGTFVFGGTATSTRGASSTIHVKGATMRVNSGKKSNPKKKDEAIDLTNAETSSDSSSSSSSSSSGSGSSRSSKSSNSNNGGQGGGYKSYKYGYGKQSSHGTKVAYKTDNLMNQYGDEDSHEYDEEVEKDWNQMEEGSDDGNVWKTEETEENTEDMEEDIDENVNIGSEAPKDKADDVSSIFGASSSRNGTDQGLGETTSPGLRWGKSTENVYNPTETPSGKKSRSEVFYKTPPNTRDIRSSSSPHSPRPGEMNHLSDDEFTEVPGHSSASAIKIVMPEAPNSENVGGVFLNWGYKVHYEESGGKPISKAQSESLKNQRNENFRTTLRALQLIASTSKYLPVIGNLQDKVYDDPEQPFDSSTAPLFMASKKNWIFFTDASKMEPKTPEKQQKPRHRKKQKDKQTQQNENERKDVWYNATIRLWSETDETWVVDSAQGMLKEAGISLRVDNTQEIHTECKAIVCGIKTDCASRVAIQEHLCSMLEHTEKTLFKKTGRNSNWCRTDDDGNIIQAPLPNMHIFQADPPAPRPSKTNPSPPPTYKDDRLAENGQVFHILAGLSGWQRLLPIIQQFEKNNFFLNFLGRKSFFILLDRSKSKQAKQQYQESKLLKLHAMFQITNDTVMIEGLEFPTAKVACHMADEARTATHKSISALSVLTSMMARVPWYHPGRGGATHLANQVIAELDPDSPHYKSSYVVFPGEQLEHQRCMANFNKYPQEWLFCYMTNVCGYSKRTALSLIKRAFAYTEHLEADIELGIQRWDNESLTVDVSEQQIRTTNDVISEYEQDGLVAFEDLTSSKELLDAAERNLEERAALCRLSDKGLSSDKSVDLEAKSMDHYSAVTGISATSTVNTSNTNAFTDARKEKYMEMRRQNASMIVQKANMEAEKAKIEAEKEELARQCAEMKAQLAARKRSEDSSISSEEEDDDDSDAHMSSSSSSDSEDESESKQPFNPVYPSSTDTDIFDATAYDKASRRHDSNSPSDGLPSDGEEESVAN